MSKIKELCVLTKFSGDISSKKDVLSYFKENSFLIIDTIQKLNQEQNVSSKQMNEQLTLLFDRLKEELLDKASVDGWGNEKILNSVLTIKYCYFISLLESRNTLWEYNYIDFSRRIGELWESMVKTCWDYLVLPDIKIYTPPKFSDTKEHLKAEFDDFVERSQLSMEDKKALKINYNSVWSLVPTGEINLSSDLHFIKDNKHHVVDFKSGFGSNEKGNKNRLLTVASAYKLIGSDYVCDLVVRTKEEDNNNYLQSIKDSGLWNIYSHDEYKTYILENTGFNFSQWLEKTVDWSNDLSSSTYESFKNKDLIKFLEW